MEGMEEGMQKQCFQILLVIDEELKRMAITRLSVLKRREEMVQTREGSRRTVDLADPSKWGVTNLSMFALTLGGYTRMLDDVYQRFDQAKNGMKDIQSNLLKGHYPFFLTPTVDSWIS